MRILIISLVLWSTSFVQAATPEGPKWPQTVSLGGDKKLTLFQPEAESLRDNVLKVRSALRIDNGNAQSYGSVAFESQAAISKEKNTVVLSKMKVTEIKIPQEPNLETTIKKDIEAHFFTHEIQIPYQNLLQSLEISDQSMKKTAVRNTPPKFIFASSPSLLIMIDGAPRWTPSSGAKEVQQVINTSALILHEDGKPYYLWALNKWFSSDQELGKYVPGKQPTSKFVMIKDQLIKEKKVDPLLGKTADGKDIFPLGTTPRIFMSTEPTELLQSRGDPQYAAIQGTSLLYMSNSANSIFLDSRDNEYYVLVSGRWFKSKQLASGWDYVNAKNLPGDFKNIPVHSPVAEVLVSVPGTPQSKEATIAAQIPQTAVVQRTLQPEKVSCDKNTYQWKTIDGTTLKYAPNCNTPLIQVSDKIFYIVQNGVWFSSADPAGPWSVATAVPSVIYTIPVSSPLYYVTFVHVYSFTGETVTVGYTPGYNGTFVSSDGTIVYGTGYYYPSYVSTTTWYPTSATYGFGVGYGWGYGDGFFMGFALGSFMYPWGWGTCCWGPRYLNVNVTNIYHKWGRTSVVSGPEGNGFRVNTIGNARFVRGSSSDLVYTRKDGEVYRRTGHGEWQKYNGPGAWADVGRNSETRNELSRQHEAPRDMIPDRTQNQFQHIDRQPSFQHQEMLRGGGGFRAGGGFHGGGFRR